MANSRPSRPRPSKPSYNLSTPSPNDSDKAMGVVADEHATHSQIREVLEHVGDRIKQHRIDAEQIRERKAQANLESERSYAEKRKVDAQNNLAHEKKLADIKSIEDEAKKLKGERFNASLLGRTLAVVGKTSRVVAKGTVEGSKVAFKVGSAGYQAITKISNPVRHSRRRKVNVHARKHHKRKRSSSRSSGEKFLFG